MKIRDFIYLDSGRMYSLYSQVFEGVADHVARTFFNRYATNNTAKKLASGQTANSSTEETLTEIESKIMYDNLYSKLEEKLLPAIKVVDCESQELTMKEINNTFIFKIIGKAYIHDYTRLTEFMGKFNKLGEIIATSIYDDLSESAKKTTSIKNIVSTQGLSQDKKLLENLKFVSEFFNNNSFEVMVLPEIKDSDIAFKGVLKREFLRVDENRLRHLYSNQPSMPWVMVGQLTFVQTEEEENSNQDVNIDEANDERSISDSYINMINASTNVESVFSNSKNYKKIHIAPIAIYVEQDVSIK